MVRLLVATYEAKAKSRLADAHRYHIRARNPDLLLASTGCFDDYPEQVGEAGRDAIQQPEGQKTGLQHNPDRPPAIFEETV